MGVYLGLVEDDTLGDYAGGYADDHVGGHPDAAPAYSGVDPPTDGGYGTVRYPHGARESPRPNDLERDYAEVEQYANAHGCVPYQITTLHPRTYNEARTIGEHFRGSTPVIMNLSDMSDADAKRLVDFAAGLIFGLRGSIDRVTTKVFLLTPHNVTVTAEDKARMAESSFFNQS
jgi:cell division inhibitor SepF